MKEITIPVSGIELVEFQKIEKYIMNMSKLYRAMSNINNVKLKELNNCVKEKGPRKGEFGYYISSNVGEVLKILEHFNIKSLVDLGSGAGIFLSALKMFGEDLSLLGYEIEPQLIQIAYDCHFEFNTVQQNIITLKKEHIENHKALYFWEPFQAETLNNKFLNNLISIISEEHIIIYKRSIDSLTPLDKHPGIECIQVVGFSSNINIYKLKS